MPYGRRVRIEPLEESVPPPPRHSLGPFFVRGVKETQLKVSPAAVTALAAATAAAGDITAIVPAKAKEAFTGGEGTAAAGGGGGELAKPVRVH